MATLAVVGGALTTAATAATGAVGAGLTALGGGSLAGGVSTLGGLASTGTKIAGAFRSSPGAAQGGGGGGFGGGGGSVPQAANPAFPFIQSLFGSAPDKLGRTRPTIAGSLFGSGEREAIQQFLSPLGLTDLEQQAPELGQQAIDQLGPAQGLFDTALSGVGEAAQTGFLTDIDPISRAARRRFERETVPQLAEQFNFGNTFSSEGFQNRLFQAGTDLETNLGAIQAELQESASSRRLQALGLAPSVAAGSVGLPISVAQDVQGLGQANRLAQESTRRGGRVLDVLGQLQGLGQNQQFIQPGFNPQGSSTAGTIGALAGAIPGVVNAASGLFGGGGGALSAPAGSVGFGLGGPI